MGKGRFLEIGRLEKAGWALQEIQRHQLTLTDPVGWLRSLTQVQKPLGTLKGKAHKRNTENSE